MITRARSGAPPSVELATAHAFGLQRAGDVDSLLGRYGIERELGRGGMGVVYAVRDLASGQRVALKTMQEVRGGAVRFRREFQTLARLEHPRVVAVYDFGHGSDSLFYTMELLEGSELQALAGTDIRRACAIIRDIASALAMLHARRLLHGDLSPRNIRCNASGQAKLIDFGLLSAMGSAPELAGTPPYMAPEYLLGLPLDQRSDLFGLGAVFYYLLSGRHPFAARTLEQRFDELRAGVTPLPVSQLAPDVPPGIETLVMSMLANDRHSRPRTAADVIDRIHALAELPAAPELEIARGYVRSVALIGRDRELRWLRARAEQATHGRGSAVLVRGRTGAGKSRLLRELGLEAKLQGVVVVHVPMDTHGRGPFEALRRIVAALLAAMPELVVRTARPRMAHLVAALPELQPYADGLEPSTVSDPREQRLVIQRAVTDWLSDLSWLQPFTLLLDDVQRCDESSAAVLLSLARRIARCRILLVGSVRDDESPLAPVPIAALARVTELMTIKGLDAGGLEALVRASFGDVPGVPRLAEFLRSKTGGSPLLATDVLSSLVDAGHIAYTGGMWMIPDDVDAAALPQSVQASCDAQVASLDEGARSLAELLAVHGGSVALETCVALVGDEALAFEAIDTLLEAEIIVGSRFVHRFRHEGVQEAVLRLIDAERRKALHRRVGIMLLEQSETDGERDAEIGGHLVAGGEELAGAGRLERAGRRLFESTSFGDAVRPLSTALEVYERHGLHAERLPELYYMLSFAGFLTDHHLATRCSPRALALLATHSGIERIRGRQRVVGARIGFLGGLAETAVARAISPATRRGPSPKHALNMFARTVLMAGGLALAQTERERLVELRRLMEPLSRIRVGNLDRVFRFLTMMESMTFGRLAEVRETGRELLAEADGRRSGSWASAFELRVFHGAVRFVYGLALVRSQHRDRALENIEALERLDIKVWQLGAQQLRQSYHLRRGETDAADEILAQLELGYVELGSVWQLELGLAPGTALARALVGDVIGLRRSIDQLERLVERGLGYIGALELTRADYHRERGELPRALEAVERALPGLAHGAWGLGWALTCRAHVLFDAGQIREASQAADDAMRYVSDPLYRDDGVYFRCARVRALIEAERGDVRGAAVALEQLIVEAAPTENPAYLGLLHEARAIAAQMADDRIAFDRHRRIADAWYRGTDNPVLIARLDRLDGSARGGRAPHGSAVITERVGSTGSVPTIPAHPLTDAECYAVPLERLVTSTGAAGGFLYLARSEGLELVASRGASASPDGLVGTLERALARGLGWQVLHRDEHDVYRPVVLRVDASFETPPVAVAALRAGDAPMHPPELVLVTELAAMIASLRDALGSVEPSSREPTSDGDETVTVVT